MNVGLMNAEGDCIAIGVYISIHALSLSSTVKDIQREFAENPGFGPGDVFMCNDPYVGACHQMDVTVVAPIFVGDELQATFRRHNERRRIVMQPPSSVDRS